MIQRHQGIGLGVVGRGIADGCRVRHHEEVLGAALLQSARPVGELRDQVDPLALAQAERGDVGGVDENHPAAALHAAVAVVEAVDRGVVLVVAAQGLQHQPPPRYRHPLQRIDREVGLAGAGVELPGIAWRMRQLEAVRLPDPAVVVGAARHHRGDGVADGVVVTGELLPRHRVVGAEHGARKLADDGDLAAYVIARRLQAAAGQVHHRHRILYRDNLLDAVVDVAVGAAQGRQDERGAAVHEMAAVELGGDLHRERAGAQRSLGDLGVGGGRGEIATHADEHRRPPVAHGPDRLDGVVAVLARAGDPEPGVQRGEETLRGLLPDAHGPVALHIGVPAHRADARAGLADHAAQQQHVGHLGDGRHRVGVLGDAHRPAHDRALRRGDHVGHPAQLRLLDAGRGQHLLEVDLTDVPHVVVEPVAVGGDELPVDHGSRSPVVGLHQQPAQAFEQGHVTAEADLHELVGDRDAVSDHPAHLLRVLESDQPGLRQRIDRDDPGPVGFRLLQDRQHPGVVGAGILSGDDDQVGVFEVVDGHRTLADTDRLDQRGARGLVAHVRAVRQVVGAEAAHHQLIEERRLVAGAPRGIEHRLVRPGQRPQMLGDQRVGPVFAVPVDGPVVLVAGPQHHRVGQPALLGQPVLRLGGQLGHRVAGEEFRGHHPAGGLLGDGLGAVLAELRELAPALLLRPGAAGAVEPVTLVEPQPGRGGANRPHLGQAASQRHEHRPYPGRLGFRGADDDGVFVIVGLAIRGVPHIAQSRPRRRLPEPPGRTEAHSAVDADVTSSESKLPRVGRSHVREQDAGVLVRRKHS